jgi:hypothetical protein
MNKVPLTLEETKKLLEALKFLSRSSTVDQLEIKLTSHFEVLRMFSPDDYSPTANSRE